MGLRSICLRDFVIVKELALDLSQGFTALTGETGAGKSILVDAIQLALGARSDNGFIREGATRTEISAEFDCPATCHPWLEQGGFELAEVLLLRRVIDSQGKSRVWINGSVATATQLRELGNYLLDIHGQHAWQSLTRPDTVRELLDGYAGLRSDTVAIFWQEWKKAQKALLDGRTALASAQEELERLDWQISEIEKLAPGESEWEELNLGHSRLAHAQTLIETAHSALDRLENDETGARSGLSRAKGLLDSQTHVEPAFQELADVLRSSLEQAEDVAHSLHAYLRNANPDPERLQQLDQRITQWIALARRYRQEPRDLYGLAASWRQKRAQFDSQADIATLEANENNAREKYLKEAKKLSESRQHAAPRLAHAVSALIQELGMQGGRFEVALSPSVQPTASGLDEVSFLVAGHAGAAPRPVGKVASGGELSRIALAIAVTTSQLGEVQTLIFDEVDAGIGGTVAQTVGRLMRQLGMDRQVLAVTHLPQVAACADHHLVVTKQEEAGTIASSVNEVVEGQRITEIARMIGGRLGSAASLAHAREMLEWGRGGEGTAHFVTP